MIAIIGAMDEEIKLLLDKATINKSKITIINKLTILELISLLFLSLNISNILLPFLLK